MNKKVVIVSLNVVLSIGVIGSIVFAGNKGKSFLALNRQEPDEWTISFDANDLMASTEYISGYCLTTTDQNHNDVLFYAENLRNKESDGIHYLDFKERIDETYSSFWNDSCINSIESLTVTVDGKFKVEWGWEKDELGKPIYLDSVTYNFHREETYKFNNEHPNYFKFTNMKETAGQLSNFVIKLKKDCTPGVNPFIVKNGIKYHKYNDHYSVAGFAGDSFANVTLPASIDGLPVNTIGEYAFHSDYVIQSINLNYIDTVENYAFSSCLSLSNINGYEHVTRFDLGCFSNSCLTGDYTFGGHESIYIGNDSFGSTNIKSLEFADDCVFNLSKDSFDDCYDLERVHFGNKVANVVAFWHCFNLKEITVSEDNPKLSAIDNVLYEKNGENLKLVRMAPMRPGTTYVMPGNVSSMMDYCCADAVYLETLVINDVVTNIPEAAFIECPALMDVTIGSNVESIESLAFSGSPLTDCCFTIPANVKTIDSHAFSHTGIEILYFEEGCTTIEDKAFAFSTLLRTVVLPQSLVNVGFSSPSLFGDVFKGCSNLSVVCTKLTSGHYENEADDCFGGRPLLYYSETEALDGEHWHYVGGDNAPRLWTTTMTIQSSAWYNADGAWFAVWAWTKGDASTGRLYYDPNAPVDYKYTISIPEEANCFIVLRMIAGADVSDVYSFPDGKYHNRSADLENVLYGNAVINGYDEDVLLVSWR